MDPGRLQEALAPSLPIQVAHAGPLPIQVARAGPLPLPLGRVRGIDPELAVCFLGVFGGFAPPTALRPTQPKGGHRA